MTRQNEITALRGPALTFTGDPFLTGAQQALRYESDALIVIEGGRISGFGSYDATRTALPPGAPVTRYGADSLILPGFVDTHVHYPQTQMIGAYGKQLIDWLNMYAFVVEQQFDCVFRRPGATVSAFRGSREGPAVRGGGEGAAFSADAALKQQRHRRVPDLLPNVVGDHEWNGCARGCVDANDRLKDISQLGADQQEPFGVGLGRGDLQQRHESGGRAAGTR